MRNKKLPINIGSADAPDSLLYESTSAEHQGQRSDDGVVICLLASEMLLVADEGNFSIEQAYWVAVADIAATEKISIKKFIDKSKESFPNLPAENAVRLSIVKYFQHKVEKQRVASPSYLSHGRDSLADVA